MNRPVDPELRVKLERYNLWEREHALQKTSTQSLREFCHLYDLISHVDIQRIGAAHKVHLADLIEVAERLKSAGREKQDTRQKTNESR